MIGAEWPTHLEPSVPPAVDFDAIDVRRTLDRLPPKEKQLLEMAYWEGLSCAEIAQAEEFVDCKTTEAVYIALSRARKRFKAHFTGNPA
jgi:DNA-directed RNA polymerase specialized sigma24 family protein